MRSISKKYSLISLLFLIKFLFLLNFIFIFLVVQEILSDFFFIKFTFIFIIKFIIKCKMIEYFIMN